MAERTSYALMEEPRGESYRALVDAALDYCDTLLLVAQKHLGLAPSAADLMRRLEPFLLAKSQESEWPGTTLLDSTKATLFRYRFNRDSARMLNEAADRLFSWSQPELPEDLSLIRPDGAPFLITIAHERNAYLKLTASEVDSFQKFLSLDSGSEYRA